jgi:hypothetical protein
MGTSQDETVDFTIRIPPSNEYAEVEGVRFAIYEGSGFLTLYGRGSGVAQGGDMITIFGDKIGSGFYSVESRHVVIMGKPLPSLSAGICTPS